MRSRHLIRSSVSAFVALFLVFIAPACFAGALTRAAASSSTSTSSFNTNTNEEREEHDDHDEHGEATLDRFGSRIVPPVTYVLRIERDVPAAEYRSRLLPDRWVPVPHPLQLSTRRLI